MARFSLLPRDRTFFDLFIQAGQNTLHAARLLDEMMHTWPDSGGLSRSIVEAENEGDKITHEIVQRLNSTFVTPIDREDIHELARSLDDVIDAIDAASTVIRRYRVAPVRFGARELATIIAKSTHQVRMAVDALERKHGVHERAVEVNRLENEADRVHDEALRRLFDEERDPIAVMKWKEVLDFLEEATDRCEDVANVLEGVVVKHG